MLTYNELFKMHGEKVNIISSDNKEEIVNVYVVQEQQRILFIDEYGYYWDIKNQDDLDKVKEEGIIINSIKDRWTQVLTNGKKEIVIFVRPDGTKYMEGDHFRLNLTDTTKERLNGYILKETNINKR
mgnify:CR=1 FL=1